MSTKVSLFFNFFLRFIILGLSVWFLYVQFNTKVSSHDFLNLLSVTQNKQTFWLFSIIVILLMPVNWGIEIFKWRLLTNKYAGLTISECVKGVLSGITISMFLPNRIGDVAGKVLWMKQGTRWKGFFSNIYASLGQLTATFLIATPAAWYFSSLYNAQNVFLVSGNFMAVAVSAIALVSVSLFFNLNLLQKALFLLKHKRFEGVKHNAQVLSLFSLRMKSLLLLLSVLRFSIYSLQFYLLLIAFGLKMPFFEGMMTIALVYFVITIIPQFAIAEIAGRGAVSVFMITLFLEYSNYNSVPSQGAIILISATMLWFINLFIPAMLGLAMLPDLKKLKSKQR
jgi:hypothetical protein